MTSATQLQTTLRTAVNQHDRIHGNQWDDGEPQEELERNLTEANEAALAAGCNPFYVMDSNISVLAELMDRFEEAS